MKIVTIFGARPQFIKASMVSRAIAKQNSLKEVTIHTGQHFDNNMSRIFFEEMGISEPDYNLDIHSLSHGAMTGKQLEEIEKVLFQEKPDWVLVYGDTNSTLAGALAAVKLHIPVAHVEAGLRSFNRRMPEEMNRILSDMIANLLFCPTETAVNNLNNEGITEGVHNVGDVMYDAVLHFSQVAEKKSNILEDLNLESKQYILATIHRQENTDNSNRLKNISSAFAESPLPIVFPMHPRTKKKLDEYNIALSGQIKPIDPVGYLDMVLLEKNAHIIATDSGGIQKEAYFHQVPCITLRDETEWVETIEMGWNKIVGVDRDLIINAYNMLIKEGNPINQSHPYGDGFAAEKILDIILNIY
jgi:UDP-GlcNAc3NAcA epimerase